MYHVFQYIVKLFFIFVENKLIIKKIDGQTNGNKCEQVACNVHTRVNKCCLVTCNQWAKWKHLLTFVSNTSLHAHIVIYKTFGNICCKAGKKSWYGVKGSRPYSVRVTNFFTKMSVQMYPNVIISEYTYVLKYEPTHTNVSICYMCTHY